MHPPAHPRSTDLLPVACAWWCALAGMSLLFSVLAPGGPLRESGLSPWASLSLVCLELAALGLAVLLGAGVWVLARRPAGSPRWPTRVLRSLAAAAILFAFAASWGSFWFTGHFLDRESLGFLAADARTVLGYAAGMLALPLLGVLVLATGIAVVASEILPRWIAKCRAVPKRWFCRITGAAVAACAAGGFLGLLESADADAEVYRARLDHASGPSTRIVFEILDRAEGPPGDAAAIPILRRPIEPEPSLLAEGPVHRWNVVVISIDSLRADQLVSFGGTREVMPVLEGLAREGVRFTDCVTTATHTDYAVPSILSSHYPLRSPQPHVYPRRPTYPRTFLYDLLKEAGYRAGAFSSQDEQWRSMSRYLDTGQFDRYFHATAERVHRAYPEGTLDDAVTVSEALRWMDRVSDAPFFMFLNLQNAHAPYHVPPGFARPFGPAHRDFLISFGWFPREKSPVVKDLYADSLAYIDLQLERLFGGLKAKGVWDQTVVVVTADHGEAFYEHGFAAHGGPLYGEATRVPLIVRAPGTAPATDSRPAQILDVPPTVCSLLGVPVHPGFQGLDLLQPHFPADRPRFMVVQTPFAKQFAVVRSGMKLIYDARLRRSVLYDLRTDPGERVDRAEDLPQAAAELESLLAAWYRMQVDYYGNPDRHAVEYPPMLRDACSRSP